MKGCRFYLEYDNSKLKRKGTVKNPGPHNGNVIAILLDDYNRPMSHISGGYKTINQLNGQEEEVPAVAVVDAIASVMYHPNSPVGSTSVSWGYLQDNCRRIPERLAREIHPNLFVYLDQS